MRPTLVTGAAGFIGYHICERLLADGRAVLALDNLNNYYDVALKEARLQRLARHAEFRFARLDLAGADGVADLFERERPRAVIHLAAQAGVTHSITNPHVYIESNVLGFLNVLEGCRHTGVGHLVYASSSSVYGGSTQMPYTVHQNVDHPLSIYAATKRANELMAHSYAHLYRLPVTGLRFFNVYGPWGRPDSALSIFTRSILAGEPIRIHNYGRMRRDFTYIDDIVEGVVRIAEAPPTARDTQAPIADPARSPAPFRLCNIGNHTPVELMYLVELLEGCLGRCAEKVLVPMQPGEIPDSFADVSELAAAVGFRPDTPIEVGVARFVDWYRQYHSV